MRRILASLLFVSVAATLVAAGQRPAASTPPPAVATAPHFDLTVDSIMRGPKLMGAPPSALRWAPDSSKLFFTWQKAGEERAATYSVDRDGGGLHMLTPEELQAVRTPPTGRLDRAHKRMLLAEGGDLVIYDVGTNARRQLTRTSVAESSPRWARNDTAVTFMRDGNLYLMTLDGAADAPGIVQLTDVIAAPDATSAAAAAPAAGQRGAGGRGGRGGGGGGAAAAQGAQGATGATGQTGQTESQRVLSEEQRALIDHLKNAQGRGGAGGGRGGGRGGGVPAAGPAQAPIARFQPGPRQSVTDMALSTDEKFVWIAVTERPAGAARNQDVPNYVTESAYPEMINGRTDVGDVQAKRLLAILDVAGNKTTWVDSSFAGLETLPVKGQPPQPRVVNWSLPDTSEDGMQTVVSARSEDTKDRWYLKVDPTTGKSTILDNLHDDAWIREANIGSGGSSGGGGGFGGGGGGLSWLPDNKRFLFLSEKDGWMHLYSLDVSATTPVAKQLTSGKWEVTDARLSADRTKIFFTSTEVHPGERHFYTMSVDGGPHTKITSMTGSNEATVSPDEKSLAIIYSYSTKPPELYMMPFTPNGDAKQATTTTSDDWRSFKWIDPKVITYKARDGAMVYARLITPEMIGAKRDPHHPAVVFIHGAGYLQNAHKYWPTSYYREYMFNNLLASRGYVVLDPDYRASSGYGRDWRTAIYEHMGGHDLEDVVDGAKFLVDTEKIDPKRIGTYGGSYGGFLTLMAMFTTPDVFNAGAALRPVTDWAHYNHGYTSNILNLPQNDIDAYRRSSPIYFADGLKNHLLICHGMVDTNVFFQDTVRLVQRLIELRKENWEVAPFPVEDHAFTEETSWASEYKRILKLFEDNLRLH